MTYYYIIDMLYYVIGTPGVCTGKWPQGSVWKEHPTHSDYKHGNTDNLISK